MSGYSVGDRKLAEDMGDDFPALNNITLRGALPSDMVPAPSKLTQITHLFFNSKIKNTARSSHENFETLQKVLQIYAIHH